MANETKNKNSETETVLNSTSENTPKMTPKETNSDIETFLKTSDKPKEIGGRDGPDPTRYGDWENKGRCVDF